MKVEGRTFVISGGSSGLGLATSIALLSSGANVSILDLNPPPSESLPLLSNPKRTLYTRTDVSKTASLQNAVDATVSWIKDTTHAPLGGVIACAGVGYGERILPRQDPASGAVKTMSIEAFDKVVAINLRGTVDLLRLVLPHLGAVEGEGDDAERGVLVLVPSVAAFEGQVGQVAYSASKAAVAGIVLPLARELGKAAGIRVVGIAPGVFETAMTKTPRKNASGQVGGVASRSGVNEGMVEYPRRMGRPEEFASLVMECLRNSMLNGSVFRLDGSVRMPSRL
ncbi:hypothetical protein AJ80_00038 [Polytolypa hystricis UAMH7299]|uniref:Ketoreductase domain-containing protein n=1 Tax=Polytolypa hystricis (strain UAMH7299) TaxID=1447883 RepID=A0A2B7Z4U4_POLH7|nr:hypothetical protein AJ80_00038 [Polytolypa hystricis UAMH7299]